MAVFTVSSSTIALALQEFEADLSVLYGNDACVREFVALLMRVDARLPTLAAAAAREGETQLALRLAAAVSIIPVVIVVVYEAVFAYRH